MIELDRLNGLDQPRFVAALDGIFEHSSWVAARTAALRPFGSRLDLLDAMRGIVQAAAPEEQLALIRAHPKLGARGRRTVLTPASAGEQRRAGLDALSPAEFAVLDELNHGYETRFEQPFILAVRGHTPVGIIEAMRRRLANDSAAERRTALIQIGLIAGYRLADVVLSPAGPETRAMLSRLAQYSDARDATGVMALRSEAVREWMLAAHLEVGPEAAGALLGRQRAGDGMAPGSPARARVLLGVHRAAGERGLRYDGLGASLLAIAVLQRLLATARSLPYELQVLALLADRRPEGWTALTSLRGATPLCDFAAAEGGDGPGLQKRLLAAGAELAGLRVIAPEVQVGATDADLETAAVRLEEFLVKMGQRYG